MSQPVAIASDSSVDLPEAEAARCGIAIAPIQIAFSREYFRDSVLPLPEFYQRLKQEPYLPTIAAPMSADFVFAYRQAAKGGEKILCLINPFESCSTYTAAYSASLLVKKEDNLTVEVMNTGRALTGLGATCLAAAELAARGASMAEVIGAIEEATGQIDSFYAPATALLSDPSNILHEGFLVGTPEKLIQSIRFWEAVGVDRIVCLINFDQMIPQEKVLASLERFAKYVMPEFAEDRQGKRPSSGNGGTSESMPMPS